ncbi:MAG: hypothetical protein F4Y95_04305 [Chloroflexi bacterium]|nr:hypothetical protein [Chloroflexota bacterium]
MFRPLAALAALLALAVFLFGAATADAQTPSRWLVSNLGRAGAHGSDTLAYDHAQKFTTGGHSAGYVLTRLDLIMTLGKTGNASNFSVSIWTAASGRPGASLGTLTQQGSLQVTNHDQIGFTPPGDSMDLDPNTTYFVMVNSQGNGTKAHLGLTADDIEDQDSALGWSIGNERLRRSHSSTSLSAFARPDAHALGHTSLKLGLSGYAKAGGGFASKLVSNTGRETFPVSFGFGFLAEIVQSFDVGTGAGFKLTEVKLKLAYSGTGAAPDHTVHIYSADSEGLPTGESLGRLTNPGTLRAALNSYVASGDGVDLESNAVYAVVVLGSSANAPSNSRRFLNTGSTYDDPGAPEGWGIWNASHTRLAGTTKWSPNSKRLSMEIHGYAKPQAQEEATEQPNDADAADDSAQPDASRIVTRRNPDYAGATYVLNGETRTVASDGTYQSRMCILWDSTGRQVGVRYGGTAPCPPRPDPNR